MNFLIEKDYFHLVRKEILDVVVDTDGKRIEAETAAESEILSYLAARYDTDKLFVKNTTWTPATVYNFNDYILLTADDYDALATYAVDDLINFTDGNIYIAIDLTAAGEDPITDPAKWTLIDVNFTFFTAIKTDDFVLGTAYSIGQFVVFEGARYENILATDGTQKPTDAQFWTLNTDTIAAGTLPSDPLWTKGDTRHPLILRYMVDITLYELHSRINPRNIPEHRIQRRDDAITYLKMVIDPRKNITPDFPEKVRLDKQDNAVVWGANTKINHGQASY